MSATPAHFDTLSALIGKPLGPSAWYTVDQERINAFADVTEDHQYIHTDKARAREEFGDTIAHGLLTLSLIVPLVVPAIQSFTGDRTLLNYGINALRFLAPVKCDSRIRARAHIRKVEQKSPGRTLLTVGVEVDVEHSDKQALVAELLLLVLE